MGSCESRFKKEKKGAATPKPQAPSGTETDMSSVERGRRDEKEEGRAKIIFGQGVEIDDDFVAPVFPKSKSQEDLIRVAARQTLLFEELDTSAMKTIVDAMEPFTATSGKTIIEQGETGDYFYVVDKGTVGFYIDGEKKGEAATGAYFGELALMYDCPRAATCKAESPGLTELWRVDQVVCKQVLASYTMKSDSNALNVIKKVTLLEDLDPAYLTTIADALIDIPFEKGATIMQKGEKGDVFYIVKEGTVKLTNIGLGESKFDDQELTVGKAFGERALVTGDVRAADATALTDCVLLALTGDKFQELLGPLDELMEETLVRRILRSIPMITRTNPTGRELSSLVTKHMEEVSYKAGKIIRSEGEVFDNPCLYVIRDGSVSLETKDGEKKTLAKGDYFGDTAIASGTFNYTIMCLDDVTCKKVSKSTIKSVLGKDVRFISVNISASFVGTPTCDPTAIMKNLEKKSILGSGTFGKVWLVKHKITGAAHALKVQKKADIIKYKQTAGVIREKKIMETIKHPFVIHMINAFQDQNRLYMVLKMYPGGELYSILHSKRRDGVVKASAVFYSAGIVEALDVMHVQNIVYRDLKPENVLLDADGYCVIVDMGFAKIVEDKTYTLCGTPLYIAPEVILSKGHNKGADIWSLGVLIFEMIYGFTPFYAEGIDQMGLFKAIVRGNFKFPHHPADKDTMDIVTRMLHRRPAYRLGCLKNGSQDLRDHSFFTGLNFDDLVQKKIEAPWKPKLKNPFDTKHFDDWSHLEKEQGRDQKLSKQQQDLFKEFA